MSSKRARNVGTVALGTVLLGLGCTQRSPDDADAGLTFPEEEQSDPGSARPKGEYPKPEFGPIARRAIEQQDAQIGPLQSPVGAPPPREEAPPAAARVKRGLLATTSDQTIAALAEQQNAFLVPSQQPLPLPPVAANAEQSEIGETLALAGDDSDNANPAQTIDSEPVPNGQTATSAEGANAAELTDAEQAPVDWPEVDFVPGRSKDALPVEEPAAVLAQKVQPVPATLNDTVQPPPEAEPSAATATASTDSYTMPDLPKAGEPIVLALADRTESQIDPAPSVAPLDDLAAAATESAQDPSTRLAYADLIQPPSPAGAQATVRTRSIPPREPAEAGTETAAAQVGPIARSNIPELASVVPPRRVPIPMTTAMSAAPVPATGPIVAANDTGEAPVASVTTLQTADLIPASRSNSILDLAGAQAGAGIEPAALSDNRQSAFSASAQPPVLSYQDELILELQVKGFDATDTIIAYGSRAGIYLPLGTLARILDIAIVVSDDGHYANGWVLAEDRSLTVDLRQHLLTRNGKEAPLAKGAAVAFEGELYILAEAFEQLMPLRIETDLRSQAVIIQTLEPFPFEERMRRDADRARLASRSQARIQEKWPREDTPYRLASLPLADIELRALSDSALGPRLESDVYLAGDLAFLTAQGFLSADSERGLTAARIELGRTDPDAQLLGLLAATGFGVGDISTVSMPIGLRGVTGRGLTITNTPSETVSVFERIDLRGILQEGYEVELYRNDILVGSTRESINGQYQFLQVPVDFGLNVFRLVFFGPQGQRSEEVRRITVGDGRLPQGKLVYRLGALQQGENVLGVRSPDFIPPRDFGNWRASAELAYGLSSDVTTVLSGAWFETLTDEDWWIASAGLRTGIGRFAIKTDIAAATGGAFAISGGIGGRFGNSALTLSHVEYSGSFIDETRSIGSEFLRRSTELDLNTSLDFGDPATGLSVPLTARIRHSESAEGRTQTNAALRASTRLPGLLVSNTLEYSRNSTPQLGTFNQLSGNFDLATASRSKTRGRLSLGYQLLPDPDITSASLEVDHALDQKTALRGGLAYTFQTGSTQAGLSAVRDFDRFTLALDGNYGFTTKEYSVGLRLGFSFGRDPLRGNFFVARPGLGASGGASLRAFRDMDGDGAFSAGDSVLPEVDFAAFNQTATTGDDGIARLTRLGAGRTVSLQVDTASLPDIDLAPARQGIEIVPRPGRIHAAEFPIVAVSEVDGTVTFQQDGRERGVSGVRLQLHDASGKIIAYARTEVEGYYFFERVAPGSYTIRLDPEQSKKLNLCADQDYELKVGYAADLINRDIDISVCE